MRLTGIFLGLWAIVRGDLGSEFKLDFFGIGCSDELDVCVSEFSNRSLLISEDTNKEICLEYFSMMDDLLDCFKDSCEFKNQKYTKPFLYQTLFSLRDQITFPSDLNYKCSYSSSTIKFSDSTETQPRYTDICLSKQLHIEAETCVDKAGIGNEDVELQKLLFFQDNQLRLNETEACDLFLPELALKLSCLDSCSITQQKCNQDHSLLEDTLGTGCFHNSKVCGAENPCNTFPGGPNTESEAAFQRTPPSWKETVRLVALIVVPICVLLGSLYVMATRVS